MSRIKLGIVAAIFPALMAIGCGRSISDGNRAIVANADDGSSGARADDGSSGARADDGSSGACDGRGRGVSLFNTTSAGISLGGSAYSLCSSLGCARLDALAPSVTVPSRGYATVPWPADLLGDEALGEAALYFAPSALGLRLNAFVCWGDGPITALRQQTTSVYDAWSGPCAPALTNGSIQRLPATNGGSAASYDTRSQPLLRSCEP